MSLNSDTAVFLTGGTGFIGSHLRESLFHQEIPVTLLIRDGTSIESKTNEEVQRGDVTLPESFSLIDQDVVIHLAAQTSIEDAVSRPRRTWNINANGTLNILEASRKADVDSFLFASTASIYGPPNQLPIDESHPMNPAEPYGSSKSAGDTLTRSYGSTYGLDTVVARIFNAFGPGQPKHNVLSTIIGQAKTDDKIELGNLSPSRDFIYIDDVVSGLLTILEEGESSTAYNIARGDSRTIGEIANIVKNTMDENHNIISTAEKQRDEGIEIPEHVADISRIRKLGWEPKYDIEEGIRRMVESF